MPTRRYRSDDQDLDAARSGGQNVAPGKRSLTSSLPPPRDVVSFDGSLDYRESRATIDGTPTTSRLDDRQLRKARERNPHWQRELGFSTALFGGGDVATGDFAENVAETQATLGLPVDGIAGPRTLGAVIRGATAPGEDPFGMHLLDADAPAGRDRSRAHRGHAPDARPDAGGDARAQGGSERRLRAEVTDVQPKDDGVQLVVGAGANHGIDERWHVHVLGCDLPWTVVEVRPTAIVVVSPRGRVDEVVGLRRVDLRGVPRDDPAWWTLED